MPYFLTLFKKSLKSIVMFRLIKYGNYNSRQHYCHKKELVFIVYCDGKVQMLFIRHKHKSR